MMRNREAHSVVVLVLEGALPLDVGIPLQVFAERADMPYRLTVCGESVGVVRVGSGIGIAVTAGLDALRTADTVIIPGYAPPTRPLSDAVRAALAQAHRRGSRMVSICYGAFALADAGLLDGLRATTHWDAAGELARRYPNIQVDPNVLFVDQGSVLSSAGVAAGLDLCLYIVRKDLGAKAANEVARRLVTAPRRPGSQAQYAPPAQAIPSASTEPILDDTRAWAHRHLDEQVTVAQMAARASLSKRTFERRFVQETGTTPHRWLLQARLSAARTLLEDTQLPIDQIAERAGLGSAANLRLHFRRVLGTTPSDYRMTFAAALRPPSESSRRVKLE
ncbi:GlxA family transcriptional regulator [Curtobacterium ammoniigenes]|uniref:GlxA family transcriptional regulator n=1 Tax=Curtobacterium ammoniigenes TaxID=395387 RepID=UPI001FDFFEC4|nr:helix-turn-helix domain-containing protein [Curtobacterium ammoniigenes]